MKTGITKPSPGFMTGGGAGATITPKTMLARKMRTMVPNHLGHALGIKATQARAGFDLFKGNHSEFSDASR
jgi:hypothetical protein